MRLFNKFLLAGVVGAGISLAAAAPANAYIICNKEGDCWHSHDRVRAKGMTFEVHPDHWYFHEKWDADRHWRDYHEGRGYWKGGAWVPL